MANTVYGEIGKDAVQYGLDQGMDWLKNNQQYDNPYPEYTDRAGPVQMDYGVGYAQNANPYEQVGGISTDWGSFQEQMRNPVYQAYDQNLRDIDNRFSGNGLYGSRGYGMNDDTLAKAGQGLMSGLLGADATAMGLYGEDLDRRDAQNQFAWKTGITEAERQGAHNANQFAWDYGQEQDAVNWANSEAGRQDAYNQNKFDWGYQQHRQPFSDYLSMASGAMPSANSAASNQTAPDAAQMQADAAGTSAWMGALGGIGGGLLGGAFSSFGGDDGWNFSDLNFWD